MNSQSKAPYVSVIKIDKSAYTCISPGNVSQAVYGLQDLFSCKRDKIQEAVKYHHNVSAIYFLYL